MRNAVLPLLLLASFAAGAGPATVALERHAAGTYYIAGAIDGVGDMEFLLDTGSSYLVLGESDLRQLQVDGGIRPGRTLDARMADGSRHEIPTYYLSALRLGTDCWIHDVEVVAFPGNSRAILGMNVLTELAPFTLSTDPPSLDLNPSRCKATPPIEALAVTSAPIPFDGQTD